MRLKDRWRTCWPFPKMVVTADEDDPLKDLKKDIAAARGKALLIETANAGWGEGRASAPQRVWIASRLGPNPPVAMRTIRTDSFNAVLAACGTPPALFDDSDGTAQREAFRRYLTMTVQPLAALLQHELMVKLEADVELGFSGLYAHDLVGRATAFKNLVAAGVQVDQALATSGLMASDG